MKIVIELDARDIGHISLALDQYVRTPGTSEFEAKPIQERFDKIYFAMWDLERRGVKALRVKPELEDWQTCCEVGC